MNTCSHHWFCEVVQTFQISQCLKIALPCTVNITNECRLGFHCDILKQNFKFQEFKDHISFTEIKGNLLFRAEK